MFVKWLAATLLLLACPNVFACTVSIDFDAGDYATNTLLDGVGWGSLDPERQNAVYSAAGMYRTDNGTASLPNNSEICVTYDDNSTESFNARCYNSPACMIPEGNHRPPVTATGGGGYGYYRYSSVWIYFGHSGCIGCVYWGEVGEPFTPPPKVSVN